MEERWIWPFELIEKIGEGAMGVVYRARSATNNRQVALKLLPNEFATDKTLTARFEREMAVLKTLKHPHIVHCHGGTCEGKRRFYAMEIVEGGSLDRILKKRGKLSWKEAAQYAIQMCSGLGFAHQQGVVHRDVKPANFLVTKKGTLKLSDFGLAHVGAATKITAAGKTMGTYHYMAPEQIRGSDDINGAADLYAIGCVLFEMLTGRSPFVGNTPAEILHQHLEAIPPSVAEYAPECDNVAVADRIINSLLQKDPKDRPKSAEAVIVELKKTIPAGEIPKESKASAGRKPKRSTFPRRQILERFQSKANWILAGCLAVILLQSSWIGVLLSTAPESAPVETSPPRAEELWIEAYQNINERVRLSAVQSLAEIGEKNEQAVATLIEALNDQNATVREAAVVALGELGGRAKSAISPLLKMHRNDAVPSIRREAVDAVAKIRKGTDSESL